MEILGIDIGGTGIKGAPVDTLKGKLLAERFRIETPSPATPKAVIEVVHEIARHFSWKGPVGCTLPAVVKGGRVLTAANIDHGWLKVDAEALFAKRLKSEVLLMNDADAAGIAEMKFGNGKHERGLVIMVTLGTGIGSALFFRGELVPNSELGHLIIRGKDAEKRASNRVREERDLSWKKWSKHVDEYLDTLERLLWPDLFIIGGGVSKEAKKFFPKLSIKAPIVPAKFLNEAGIVGVALAAATAHGAPTGSTVTRRPGKA